MKSSTLVLKMKKYSRKSNRFICNEYGFFSRNKGKFKCTFSHYLFKRSTQKIRAVLDDFQPDVVHLNNIQYHLTPSIILETNKWRKETRKECKIVYTTHDYQLVCPSHGMFDVNMKPCERCLDGHYIHCLQTKCLKNSRAKSLLGTLDGYMWKYSKAYSYVDAYICCSFFLKSKLDTQKRFRDKTIGLHNFKKRCRTWITFKKGLCIRVWPSFARQRNGYFA